MTPDLKTYPDIGGVGVKEPGRVRPFLELCVGYGLILATIWTPRPLQRWLYLVAVAWVLLTTVASFPGWATMGFRRGGFFASLWVVFSALVVGATAAMFARKLNTLHEPHGLVGWIMTFGGYTVWSFVQQFLLQGYFLFRLLRVLPRREWAALAAASIFAAAHLPNPILTPVTLIWGICACFVFLRSRNVYPLAMAHAILGITVAITIPGPVVRNMRVGLGYLRYHGPHIQHVGHDLSGGQ
jgi:membrane protease YdiL (CAAX protease family)